MQMQKNTSGRTSRAQKNGGTVVSPALQSQIAKEISAALRANIETKHVINSGSGGISWNGSIVSVTANLVRGDSSINECTGTLIKPLHFKFSANLYTDQTYSTLRVMLFRWKDASTPAPSGVINNTGSIQGPHGPVYWVNNRKIVVLHDEVVALCPRAAAGSFDNKIVKFERNLGDCPVIQLPASGAGVTPQMDGLYLLFISDDSIVTYPGLAWASELRFTDA